ncbi:MAG: glycosyltransferase family 4 protein [Acetobacteraceae bacterium]|nr:glycosyltransferase family 4 protein [Acetobacteraceae bacterium]
MAIVLPPKERFAAACAGAVALVVRDLARATPAGWSAEVLGADPGGEPFAGAAFRALRPRLLDAVPGGRSGAFARAAARTLGADPPDVIEAHNRAPLALSLAAALPRTPVLLVLHNEARTSEGLATPAERTAALSRLAGIVCVSEFVRRGVAEGVPPELAARVHAIPNGIPPEAMPPPAAVREPTILFVGRLVPEKGADAFVAACARALPSLPGWRAEIVGARWYGKGRDSPYAAAVRREAAAAGIAVAGFLDNAETLARMARAAIVVVPSRWPEPLGRVAQEALACGAALVSSGRGGLPEATGEAALVADPDDPAALAGAILRLARDPELRADLAARGRAQVLRFAMPAIVGRWTALRTSLLGEGRQHEGGHAA